MAPAILQRSISYNLAEAIQGMMSPSSSTNSLQSLHESCRNVACNHYYECDGNGFVLLSAKNDFNNNGSVKRQLFQKSASFSVNTNRKSRSFKFGEINFKVRAR